MVVVSPTQDADERPTVLVTGVGGPAGVSVLQALRAAGHRVLGVDASPSAVGLRLADRAAVVPRPDEPEFVPSLCVAAASGGARVLVATVAEELVALHRSRGLLDEVGLAHWLADPVAVETCTDKWRFHVAASQAGLPVPATVVPSAGGDPTGEVSGPWIVKPRHGRGSRDIVAVDDAAELRAAIGKVPEPLVQQRLGGREFTVDVLVGRDGSLEAAVPRWRLETKAGISVQGLTFHDPTLVDLVSDLVSAVGLTGAANVQGFAAEGADPPLAFTEINPRFSGGLPLSLAAGCDLVGEFVRGACGLPLRGERLRYRPGVRMLRYFQEVFEEDVNLT